MSAAVDTIAPSPETQEFLGRKHQLLINGEWVDSGTGETFEIHDPASSPMVEDFRLKVIVLG